MTSSSNGGKAAPSGGSARPPANAWNQPLRTKANQPPPPGMGVAGKAGGGGKNQNAAGANNSSNNSSGTNHGNIQNALRERFIGLSLNMVGQKVVVSQTNGAVFEGIFHTFSPFAGLPAETKNKYVIKACRVIKQPEDKRSKLEDQATVIVSADKVACLTVKSLRIDTLTGNNNNNNKNGGQSNKKSAADAFRTDTEISGGRMDRNREFVAAGSAWTSAAGGGGGGNSRAEALMGDEGASSKRNNRGFNSAPNSKAGGLEESIGEWDQFRANQELFNVKGNYDENLYTTELDKSQMNKEQLAEAERLAREIESTTTSNIHLAEERGQILQGDYDEEDLYSGVLKDGSVKPVIRSKANADAGKGKAAAPKKMNYAAAAAKADVGKKVAPPGFASKAKGSTLEKATDKEPAKVTPEDEKKTTTKDTAEAAPATKEAGKANTEEKKDVKAGVKPTDEKEADKIEDSTKGATKGAKSEEKPAEAPAPKPASKLNANAKEFTLNPSAKTFTPGGGMAAGAAAATQDAQYVDPNAAMHMGQIPPHMQGQPHYMHVPMGQPGMYIEVCCVVLLTLVLWNLSFTHKFVSSCYILSRNDAHDAPISVSECIRCRPTAYGSDASSDAAAATYATRRRLLGTWQWCSFTWTWFGRRICSTTGSARWRVVTTISVVCPRPTSAAATTTSARTRATTASTSTCSLRSSTARCILRRRNANAPPRSGRSSSRLSSSVCWSPSADARKPLQAYVSHARRYATERTG